MLFVLFLLSLVMTDAVFHSQHCFESKRPDWMCNYMKSNDRKYPSESEFKKIENNLIRLRRYLRVREKILEELNSDNNNVGILKKFLNKMKIAYKEDSGIIIDESKLIRLYKECRTEVLNDNN